MNIKNLPFPVKVAGAIISAFTALILFLILSFGTFFQVESGERGLVFTNGDLKTVAEEGLHIKAPFFQTVKKVDITTQSTTVPNLDAASKDLQAVKAGININYHLNPNELISIYETTKMDIEARIIQPRAKEALKVVSAKYTAEELIRERSKVKAELDEILVREIGKYNIKVDDVQLVNFTFSEAFNDAIEAKQTEVQNTLKAQNILERTKVESEQRIVQAKAEAEAIRIQAEAIRSQGGQEYVHLKWIEKWDGKLPTMTGANGILINGTPYQPSQSGQSK